MSEPTGGQQQVAPIRGWDELTEDDVIAKLDAAVADAIAAARMSVIGIANYVNTHESWPRAIDRANELLNELDDTQSRYWG
jgi:hypothetical protein